MTTNLDTDRIERSIEIEASAERVFGLISEPGWFVNDGEITEHTITTEGQVSTVHDPKCGTFRIETVTLEPPHYAAFRWRGGSEGLGAPDDPHSLIEFRITQIAGEPSQVRLTVVESGLAALDAAAVEQRRRYDENARGWEQELQAAARYLSR